MTQMYLRCDARAVIMASMHGPWESGNCKSIDNYAAELLAQMLGCKSYYELINHHGNWRYSKKLDEIFHLIADQGYAGFMLCWNNRPLTSWKEVE